MAQAFLNASLDELVERTETETRQDILYTQIETVKAGLESKLLTIHGTLDAKRTFWGWGRDIAGNLLVNLVSIFVLGALVLGYKFSGELQQGAENRAGLGTATTNQNNPMTGSAPTRNVTPKPE
ncbi:hypothetical protein ACHAC9_14450 [Massilia sp. CMS3.1]|uniref:hypothetical protein n=1 Tax=Massilia sp. CMS3.1 TaxID=3373083 RepID=UPI003EE7B344